MEKETGEIRKLNPHVLWIDVLKGVAIILVVIGHNANDDVKNFIFCFHMPLFYMLSGFLFSPKPIKQYFTKSIKRLLIPYIAFLFVIALPEMIVLAANGGKMSAGGVNRWRLV